MFDESRCQECGRIHFGILRVVLRNELKSFIKSMRRCEKCKKRGIYEKNEGRRLCWECWSDETGLPF
jgi:hypothetical protein